VLKDVEGAHAGKVAVGKGKPPAVVGLAAGTKLARARDVGLRDIDPVGFIAGFGQSRHDLADPTAHVEHTGAAGRGLEGVRILRIEAGVPPGKEPGVVFVLLVIRILMAHSPVSWLLID
jgi:hypothetical protein